MKKLTVNLPQKCYEIIFSDNFNSFPSELKKITKSNKAFIVTDSNVDGLYREEIENRLKNEGFSVSYAVIEAGEKSKNLQTVESILKKCIDEGLDRKSFIIALGGGVVGDISGFAAAIYMRGIDFVQVPTTLLSQSDSSVGGKTGVDFSGGKNIIGAFLQPKLVYINTATLKTLPDSEFTAGMGEVIKHAIIADADFFEFLKGGEPDKKNADRLIELCYKNCAIKAQVVEKDEKEQNLRMLLNFGHTIGHAIEAYSEFRLLHGECVALGIAAAGKIAEKRSIITNREYSEMIDLMGKYGLATRLKITDIDKITQYIRMDKKADRGKIKFILPEGIGRAGIYDDVTDSEIKMAIEAIERK